MRKRKKKRTGSKGLADKLIQDIDDMEKEFEWELDFNMCWQKRLREKKCNYPIEDDFDDEGRLITEGIRKVL